MNMTESEKKVYILGDVFEEFRELLKNGKLEPVSFTEEKFIGILKNILNNEVVQSNNTYLSTLGDSTLNPFYNKVKKLVELFSTRIPMKTKKLMFGTWQIDNETYIPIYQWTTKSTRILSHMKNDTHPDGIDIESSDSKTAESVRAIFGGTVTFVYVRHKAENLEKTGVRITGDDGHEYRYENISPSNNVITGERVEAGTEIGLMQYSLTSGISGTHMFHLEVLKEGGGTYRPSKFVSRKGIHR